MSDYYNIHLNWTRDTDDFDYKNYNRKHTVFFYGGPKIEVSSAPDFLRNPQFQSPEELLVAAVSSCFLLTFLSIAAKRKFIVDSYQDNATCILGNIDGNKKAVTHINLRPVIAFVKESKPDEITMKQLFKTAHDNCFIANSLTATITVTPEYAQTLV